VNHVTLKPAVSSKLHSHFDVSSHPHSGAGPPVESCRNNTPNAYSKGISCTYLQDTKHCIASWHQALPVVSCMKEHTAHANAAVSDQVHVCMKWDAYVKDRNGSDDTHSDAPLAPCWVPAAGSQRAPGCCIAAQAHQKLALHSAVLLDKELLTPSTMTHWATAARGCPARSLLSPLCAVSAAQWLAAPLTAV
jgi:hypothetical protein